MKRIKELEKSMLKSCKFRKHSMVKVHEETIGERVKQTWDCERCGLGVHIDTHPAPNGVDIGGSAVAVNCSGQMSFKVIEHAQLDDEDKLSIEHNEALWFYHSYYRTELELLELAHSILLKTGKHNYKQTQEYKDMESILAQFDKADNEPEKIRFNCSFTGQFTWVELAYMSEIYNDLIYNISDYITQVYSLEGYTVEYMEGEWGLWPYLDEEDIFNDYSL